jgi:hypothetical protein
MDRDAISRASKIPGRRSNRPAAGQHARLASALIIPNSDRALHTLIAHFVWARLRD